MNGQRMNDLTYVVNWHLEKAFQTFQRYVLMKMLIDFVVEYDLTKENIEVVQIPLNSVSCNS